MTLSFLRRPRLGLFAQNLLAYGASEVAAKASRLLVVIAVARVLDVSQIGLAAAAIAAGDILKSLTENGVGQRIIAARDADLAATCRTAHRIFWGWCIGLFALQCAVGAAVYAATGDAALLALILILAGEYLFMPGGLVQVHLAMREGKLKQTAMVSGAQIVGANLISAALALLWPSALALVLPRLLAAPIWLLAVRRLRPWRPDATVTGAPLRPFIDYGRAVLGVEIVKALRLQADKLAVGALMGAEALGLYFMAFNAGLGLSQSFSIAFAQVIFPHLATARDRTAALRQAVLLGVGVITPVVIVQSLLAPWYVPILFGAGWDGISNVVSILCLAAIPGLIWVAASGWMRAEGRPQTEFLVTLTLAVALTVNTVLMAPYGLTALAWGTLIVAAVVQVAAALPALRHAFFPQLVRV